jgi:hypothetical protein
MENKWVTCNDVIAPFVTSIKIYLPLGDYKDVQKQHTITTTTITNDLGEDICVELHPLISRIHIRDGKLVLDGKIVCENPSEYEFREG